MALVKLPDGQIVNSELVESVEGSEFYGSFPVTITLKSKKTVTINCSTEEAQKEMLAKVADCLGV